MEAAGALGAAAPILESISNPPGGAGQSWVGCGCQKDPILDQIPTCLVQRIAFQTVFFAPKNVSSPMPTSMFNTTCESFQMRYCMTFYLKGHQNYQNSKLKIPKKSAFIK